MAEERRIDVGDVQVGSNRSVVPSGQEVVASYNWSTNSKRGNPCIIVPGAPRKYVSPGGREFSLGRDAGESLVDENASRMHPFSATEPIFHALAICSPSLNLDTVDIVADRNTMRNLLMVCGSPRGSKTSQTPKNFSIKPFRFLVQGIGEDGGEEAPTMLFSRVTTGREEHYPGYSGGLEEKLTQADPRAPTDAGNFSVVVKMNLDGIVLLVRSKPKACQTASTKRSTAHLTSNIEDDLSVQLGSLLVSSQGKSEAKLDTYTASGKRSSATDHTDAATTSGLMSTISGEVLGDGTQLLELKSKSRKHAEEINWEDIYWQMAFGGTHKLVLGLHNRGKFNGVEELTIEEVLSYTIEEVKNRADKNGSSSMVYLVNTLREVIRAANCLMAAPAYSSTGKTGKGPRPFVAVQYLPDRSGGGSLRVRLAVPADGPIAP